VLGSMAITTTAQLPSCAETQNLGDAQLDAVDKATTDCSNAISDNYALFIDGTLEDTSVCQAPACIFMYDTIKGLQTQFYAPCSGNGIVDVNEIAYYDAMLLNFATLCGKTEGTLPTDAPSGVPDTITQPTSQPAEREPTSQPAEDECDLLSSSLEAKGSAYQKDGEICEKYLIDNYNIKGLGVSIAPSPDVLKSMCTQPSCVNVINAVKDILSTIANSKCEALKTQMDFIVQQAPAFSDQIKDVCAGLGVGAGTNTVPTVNNTGNKADNVKVASASGVADLASSVIFFVVFTQRAAMLF
jgi:hypothetical protein